MMNISDTDSELLIRECKRKKPYPTWGMAEKAAAANTKETGHEFRVFKCRHGDHYHIGKRRLENMESKIFFQIDGVALLRIKVQDDQWILMVPAEEPATITDDYLIEAGILVAIRKGSASMFLTKDGAVCKNNKFYNHMYYMYPKDGLKFRVWAVDTEMHTYDEALKLTLDKKGADYTESASALAAPGRRIIVNRKEEVKQIAEQEMYKGRAVFRTPDGKPFYRDIAICVNDDCTEEIELRTYIASDAEGNFSTLYKRVPLDGKATRRPGSSRQSMEWLCKNCSKEGNLGKNNHTDHEHEVLLNPPPPPLSAAYPQKPMALLLDLQRVAKDESVEAEFVRGATLMVCFILNEAA